MSIGWLLGFGGGDVGVTFPCVGFVVAVADGFGSVTSALADDAACVSLGCGALARAVVVGADVFVGALPERTTSNVASVATVATATSAPTIPTIHPTRDGAAGGGAIDVAVACRIPVEPVTA